MTRDRLTLRLSLRLTRARLLAALALACLTAAPQDLASMEQVALSTYYPAPTGVYTQVVTNDATWLAQNSGTVTIGSANAPNPGIFLRVDGNAVFSVGMSINKTTAPTFPVDVAGGTGNDVVLSAGGGTIALKQTGANAELAPGGGGPLGLEANGAELVYLSGNGRLSTFGNLNPQAELDIAPGGTLSIGAACSGLIYVPAGVSSCGGGQYATLHPGIYTDIGSNGSEPGDNTVSLATDGGQGPPAGCTGPGGSCAAMYCCPIPSGGAIW